MMNPYVIAVIVRSQLDEARADAARSAAVRAATASTSEGTPSHPARRNARTIAGLTLIRLGAWLVRSASVARVPGAVVGR